jgi:hypothetical protein
MHYFLDTEFNEFGGELISLALVNDGGDRELYVATDCAEPGEWVKENVLPIIHCPGAHATVIPPDQFGRAIAFFLRVAGQLRRVAKIRSRWLVTIDGASQAAMLGLRAGQGRFREPGSWPQAALQSTRRGAQASTKPVGSLAEALARRARHCQRS